MKGRQGAGRLTRNLARGFGRVLAGGARTTPSQVATGWRPGSGKTTGGLERGLMPGGSLGRGMAVGSPAGTGSGCLLLLRGRPGARARSHTSQRRARSRSDRWRWTWRHPTYDRGTQTSEEVDASLDPIEEGQEEEAGEDAVEEPSAVKAEEVEALEKADPEEGDPPEVVKCQSSEEEDAIMQEVVAGNLEEAAALENAREKRQQEVGEQKALEKANSKAKVERQPPVPPPAQVASSAGLAKGYRSGLAPCARGAGHGAAMASGSHGGPCERWLRCYCFEFLWGRKGSAGGGGCGRPPATQRPLAPAYLQR